MRIGTATVTKSATPATATIGAPVSYTVRVTVPASIAVYDLTVTDVVPDAIDVDGYTSEACVSGCPVPNAINRYTPVVNGNGTTTLAWDFGDIAVPLGTPLVVDLTYSGHVRATHRNGGANVLRGQTAVNSVTVAEQPHRPGRRLRRRDHPHRVRRHVEPGDGHHHGDRAEAHRRQGGPRERRRLPRRAGDRPVRRHAHLPRRGHEHRRRGGLRRRCRPTRPDSELTGVTLDAQAGVTVTDGWTAGDPAIAWRIDGPIAPGASVTLTYSASLVAEHAP